MTPRSPELTGWLTLTTAAEGGRSGAVVSAYRPEVHLPPGTAGKLAPAGETVITDCAFEFDGVDQIAPGETAHVRITPLHPEFWTSLEPGETVAIAEGGKIVGSIRIERTVDQQEVAEWQQFLEERRSPGDLAERIGRIRKAMADYVRPA